jgi:hypothetical protein
MKITLEINDLDYGALVAALLPAVHEKLDMEDGSVMNKILSKLTALSPSIAEKMVNLLPKETQNEIAVLLINKNQSKIIALAEQLADEKDISVRIGHLEAQI